MQGNAGAEGESGLPQLMPLNCSCVKYTPLAEKTEVPGGGKPGTQRIQRLGGDEAVKATRL